MKFKKTILITLLFSAISILLGFTQSYYLPKLKSWAIFEIEEKSHTLFSMKVSPQSLKISLFPLKVKLYKVQITPQATLQQNLMSTTFKQVDVHLSFWFLLTGNYKIKQVTVRGGSIQYIHKASKRQDKKRIAFDHLLSQQFVHRITFKNVDLYIKDVKENFVAYAHHLYFDLQMIPNSLLVTLDTSQLLFGGHNFFPVREFKISTHTRVSKNQIQIISSNIEHGDSLFNIHGTIKGSLDQMQYKSLNINTRGYVHMGEVSALIKQLFPKKKIPKLKGFVNVHILATHTSTKNPQIEMDLFFKEAYIKNINIGNVTMKGIIKENMFHASLFEVENSGARAQIKNLKMDLRDNHNFSGNIHVSQFTLNRFLVSLGLGEIPLHLYASGEIPCKGHIKPAISIECTDVEVKLPLLHVFHPSNVQNTIVKLKKSAFKGSVKISNTEITYKSHFDFSKIKGVSTGTIHYQKGFHIKYQGEIGDFLKIDNIINQKITGSAKIKGFTEGNMRQAICDLHVQGNQMTFMGWLLGSVQSHVRYEKGNLHFNQINGQIDNAKYKGFLWFDFLQHNISLQLNSPLFAGESLNKFLDEKFKFKFDFHGTGQARFNLSGPLSQPSYKLLSKFQGSLYKEEFQELVFNISSQGEKINTDKVFMRNGQGHLEFKGFIKNRHNKGYDINGELLGKHIPIEQLNYLGLTGKNLSGQIDFQAHLDGPFKHPNTDLHGTLSKTILGGYSMEDSDINLKINQKQVSGSVQFMGNQIRSLFQFPFEKTSQFSLSLYTNQWDFAHFLSSLARPHDKNNFRSQITTEIHLHSKRGGFWESSGQGVISRFEIHRGTVSMEAPRPMEMIFSKGAIKTKYFKVIGDKTYLELKSAESTYNNLNMYLEGVIDLSLTALIMPFLDEIRGKLSLSTQISGSLNKPRFQGFANMDESVVRVKEFPHQIRDLSAKLLLKKNQLILSQLEAKLPKGTFTASGQAHLIGKNNTPVDVKVQFNEVALNIPEGIHTEGSGHIHIHGETFPYKLTGKYTIEKGSISTGINSLSKPSKPKVKTSLFLPEFIRKPYLNPLDLSFNIDIQKPIDVNTTFQDASIRVRVGGGIKALGPVDRPRFRGQLNVEPGGQFDFNSNTFDINEGRFIYEDSPFSDPKIHIHTNTRINEYDINVQAYGTVQDAKINFKSQPPLPRDQIVSLIFLSVTPSTSDNQTIGSDNINPSTLQATSAILNEKLSILKKIRKDLGVRVNISSSYNKRIGKVVPLVTATKQWGPDLKISLLRSLSRTTQENRLQAEYQVNKNVSIIGSFETRDSEGPNVNQQQSDIFGIDLEYKVNFNLNK